jgi:hypothetical protein
MAFEEFNKKAARANGGVVPIAERVPTFTKFALANRTNGGTPTELRRSPFAS